jgi:hypothetical protein
VGRPLQDLIRRWGIELICKDSIPDHRLGIQATHDLAKTGEKIRCGDQRENVTGKSTAMGSESRGFKEDSKN